MSIILICRYKQYEQQQNAVKWQVFDIRNAFLVVLSIIKYLLDNCINSLKL